MDVKLSAETWEFSTVIVAGVGTEFDFNSSPEVSYTVRKHANALIRVVRVLRVPLKKASVRTPVALRVRRTHPVVSHHHDFPAFWKIFEAACTV